MIIVLCPNPSVDKLLHLDDLVPGDVNRSAGEHSYPGGKGVHVAMALQELQTETELIGFWGGPAGDWIREECRQKTIASFGPVLQEWTRTCLTILTPDPKTSNTEILEKGPKISSENLHDFFKITERKISDAAAVCVSGSWPADTPAGVYKTLKTLCDARNVDLWVDASGTRLEEALKVKPFGVHINKQEAKDFFGEDLPAEKFAEKLLDYCSMAALTDGANGLYLAWQSQVIHASCKVDNVISTVGSGDCLTAGILSEWYQTKDIMETARTGTACGAANCVYPELGMLQKSDVDAFKALTKISTLK